MYIEKGPCFRKQVTVLATEGGHSPPSDSPNFNNISILALPFGGCSDMPKRSRWEVRYGEVPCCICGGTGHASYRCHGVSASNTAKLELAERSIRMELEDQLCVELQVITKKIAVPVVGFQHVERALFNFTPPKLECGVCLCEFKRE